MNPVAPVIATRITAVVAPGAAVVKIARRSRDDGAPNGAAATGAPDWSAASRRGTFRAHETRSREVTRFLLVCFGGAVGTGARFLVSGWALALLGPDFPYGTLAVNVIGSLLLGTIMHVGLTTDLLSPTLRLTLATGVMGGFTTYSTFNYETLQYLEQGAWWRAGLNVVVTLLVCLVAGVAGTALARRIVGG